VCARLGARPVLIELPSGTARSQLMTSRYHRGPVAVVVDETEALCAALAEAGLAVVRVKLEAVAGAEGVPETDAEAARLPADNYFEFHLKLLLSPDADLTALAASCARHDARLSRNAFKARRDGQNERFVTQRRYGVGRRSAFAGLEGLERDLAGAGFAVVARQREYAIFDSAVGLDAGWIDAPDTGGGS
jgi:hypothetical protein